MKLITENKFLQELSPAERNRLIKIYEQMIEENHAM